VLSKWNGRRSTETRVIETPPILPHEFRRRGEVALAGGGEHACYEPQGIPFLVSEPEMKSSTRGGPDKRPFRIEKRLPSLIPFYLASVEDRHTRERTFTENVSPHGARVISERSWQQGEKNLITPSSEEFQRVGRVVYCSPTVGDRCCLGLEFPDRAVKCDELSSA
jgi:hypothetical protein